MPRFFVRQPDGKLAEFSTVVDNFTAQDLSHEEALQCCNGMSWEDALEKVRRGEEDAQYTGGPQLNMDQEGNQLKRWEDCLGTILIVHGWEECLSRMRLLGGQAAVAAWIAVMPEKQE